MPVESDKAVTPGLQRRLDRLREPFKEFIGAQATASGILLLALLAALALANSPLSEQYEALKHYPLGLVIGGEVHEWSLRHLVNDGLIALFFFLIGLEFKRELLAGELHDRARVRFLAAAAIGGMVLPASVYLGINLISGDGQLDGWGIPMATDTALAIGVLMALGSRVPRSAVAFLVGLAIIDDLGAILVIAFFYTEQVVMSSLALSALLLGALLLFNRAGLRHPLFYGTGGVLLWITIVQSGVHASIAGVIVAATVPARPRIEAGTLRRKLRGVLKDVAAGQGRSDVLADQQAHRKIARVEQLAQAATTPLQRWEEVLELPVALLVLPLFVFLNAGIPIEGADFEQVFVDPVSLGVMLGLLVGKPCGILAGVYLAEFMGWARRPAELTPRSLLGIGLLAGIGFTMSTFIANLALGEDGESMALAKLAILLASIIAAVAGYAVLRTARD